MENIPVGFYHFDNQDKRSPKLKKLATTAFHSRIIQNGMNKMTRITSKVTTPRNKNLKILKKRLIQGIATIAIIVAMPITIVLSAFVCASISSLGFGAFLYENLQSNNFHIIPTILAVIITTHLATFSGIVSGALAGILLSCLMIYLITQDCFLNFATKTYKLAMNFA